MSSKTDPRKVREAQVCAKVALVVLEAECKRMFGSLWKSKILHGTVEKVKIDRSSGRESTTLIENWSIVGKRKRIEVALGRAKISVPHSTFREDQTEVDESKVSNYNCKTLKASNSGATPSDSCGSKAQQHICACVPTTANAVAHGILWRRKGEIFPLNGTVSGGNG